MGPRWKLFEMSFDRFQESIDRSQLDSMGWIPVEPLVAQMFRGEYRLRVAEEAQEDRELFQRIASAVAFLWNDVFMHEPKTWVG